MGLQIATTREHSAPRNRVCGEPGAGPAQLCSAPHPSWQHCEGRGVWMRLSLASDALQS